MNTYELKTGRLLLREIREEDVDKVHSLNSQFTVSEFNTIGIPQTLEDTRQLIQPVLENQKNSVRTLYTWIICLRHNEEFLGEISLSDSQNRFRMGEISYSIVPSHWGNGYATEAVKRIVDFGFEDLNLHRIQAGVATENKRSIAVLEKVRMLREGQKRKVLPIRGEWKDNYMYAILESD